MTVSPVIMRLILRRAWLGESRKAVARRIAMAPSTLKSYEIGKRVPPLLKLEAWAAALGTEIDVRVKSVSIVTEE